MKYYEERKEVLAVACRTLKEGLIHGTSGNVSMRVKGDNGEDVVIITPSGIPYDTLKPEDMVIVDLFENKIEGDLKPSSETPLHTAVYRARKDVNGIVHSHSMFATVYSILKKEIPVMVPPCSPYGPVPVAKFEMPGSEELGASVVEALGTDHFVVTMQNHGQISCCPTLDMALKGAEYVEESAQIAYLTNLVNGTNPLSDEAAAELKQRQLNKLAV